MLLDALFAPQLNADSDPTSNQPRCGWDDATFMHLWAGWSTSRRAETHRTPQACPLPAHRSQCCSCLAPRDPAQRPTAKEALQHKWVVGGHKEDRNLGAPLRHTVVQRIQVRCQASPEPMLSCAELPAGS